MAKRHWNRSGDLESLFLRLEELVLANSGEDEFEEIFKLLIAKIWDERLNGEKRFRVYDDEGKTFAVVSNLLVEAERSWPGILGEDNKPQLTPEHLQVCVQALSQHTVSGSDLEVLDGFFEFLVARAEKGAKGQYFTPRHVIELCVRMIKPKKEDIILDPACGSGGFLLHTLSYIMRNEGLKGESLRRYCETKLWGFDISSRAVRVAKALMLLVGDGRSNIMRLNSLLQTDMGGLFPLGENDGSENGTVLTIEDVCRTRLRHHKGFDIILTNPPFAGEVREGRVLEAYAVSQNKSRVERDVLFLERCVKLLKPGGRLAIVLPHNKFAGSSFEHVRQWLVRHARILAVVGLGRNTFLPHTHQKASVLFAQRRMQGEREQSDEKTFFAVSEKDGKNSKGQVVGRAGSKEGSPVWERADHDFEEVVSAYQTFMEKEQVELKGT